MANAFSEEEKSSKVRTSWDTPRPRPPQAAPVRLLQGSLSSRVEADFEGILKRMWIGVLGLSVRWCVGAVVCWCWNVSVLVCWCVGVLVCSVLGCGVLICCWCVVCWCVDVLVLVYGCLGVVCSMW
jgi:hypothetical protein